MRKLDFTIESTENAAALNQAIKEVNEQSERSEGERTPF